MAHKIYPLEVLENKFESQVMTALDLSNYATADISLDGLEAGMTKKIVTWNYSGEVEEVEMGAGNTQSIEVGNTSVIHEVGVTQGRFDYYDEQEMINPAVVDTGLKGLSERFVNDVTVKVIGELTGEEAKQIIPYTTNVSFDNFVDAVAVFGENAEGLFALVHPKMLAQLRKTLKDDLKYVEGFVRTGYVGSICGVPVTVTASAPEGEVVVANREAVTIFTKKGAEMETERDANIRKNSVYSRKVALVALTNATKVVRIKKQSA